MHRLTLILLVLSLLSYSSGSLGGILGSALRASAAAGKIERGLANGAAMERAGANAAKAGLSAERTVQRLSPERSAGSLESNVVRQAKEVGPPRARDGRYLLDAGPLSARLLQERVGAALVQTNLNVLQHAADGRYIRLVREERTSPSPFPLVLVADSRKPAPAVLTPNVQLIRAAQQAVADTVGSAFRVAVLDLRDRYGPNRRASPAEVRAETLELLRILQDDSVLVAAQKVSAAVAAGRGGANLWDVAEVAMHRQKSQPTALWIRLTATKARPFQGVWARVNVDDVLGRIRMDGL